jgi:hypothetical protein
MMTISGFLPAGAPGPLLFFGFFAELFFHIHALGFVASVRDVLPSIKIGVCRYLYYFIATQPLCDRLWRGHRR